MVALAGLLFTGLAVFTVDGARDDRRRGDRGRRLASRCSRRCSRCSATASTRAGSRSSGAAGRAPATARGARSPRTVTRHPVAALVTAVCVLGALAVPALDMHAGELGRPPRCRRDTPVRVAERAIDRAFPGAPNDAERRRHRRGTWTRRPRSAACGPSARGRRAVTGGRGVGRGPHGARRPHRGRLGPDARPRPRRREANRRRAARRPAAPPRGASAPGTAALVTGDAAGSARLLEPAARPRRRSSSRSSSA